MVFADLHNHTVVSDGELTLNEVIDEAKKQDIRAISITDHDKINPKLDQPIQNINGVDVIHGIELRVEPENVDNRVDLLGYGVNPTEELRNIQESITENRIKRALRMIDLIEEHTGVRLNYEPTGSTGRPHIARAIDQNPNLDYNYNEAFEHLIGHNCPGYTSRDIPSFQEGLDVLRKSSMFISLAHPYRYENIEDSLELSQNLDGVECEYPYHNKNVKTPEKDIARLKSSEFDLCITGGSDSHNSETIGDQGLSEDQYRKFLSLSGLEEYN